MTKIGIILGLFMLSNQMMAFTFGEKTKTNITLKNEFGIAYPNAKILFSSLDTNFIITVDKNGLVHLSKRQKIFQKADEALNLGNSGTGLRLMLGLTSGMGLNLSFCGASEYYV